MKNLLIVILIFFSASAFADVQMSPEYECCIETNFKLQKQIDNQKVIIKSLQDIDKNITLQNDTLQHSLKIELKELHQGKENNKKGCDLCGVLGAALGAIISAFVSLFIYKRGEKKDKAIREEKERKRQEEKIQEIERRKEEKKAVINDFGEDVYLLTNDSVSSAKTQIEAIKGYIKRAEKELHKAHLLRRVPVHQLARIRSFEIDKVKQSFRLLNLTNKDFVNFYNQVDYLYEVYSALHEDYEDTNTNFVTPLSNKFLKIRQEILTDITEHTEKLRKEGKSESELYKYLDNLVKEYLEPIQGQLVPDIKYDYDNFIFKLIVELVTKYRDDEFSGIAMRKLQSAKELYISVIGASTHFVTDLKDRISNLEKSTETLNEINDKLKENYAS